MPSTLGRGLWGLEPPINHKTQTHSIVLLQCFPILVLAIQCIASPDPGGHINYSGLGLAVSRDSSQLRKLAGFLFLRPITAYSKPQTNITILKPHIFNCLDIKLKYLVTSSLPRWREVCIVTTNLSSTSATILENNQRSRLPMPPRWILEN